MQLRRSFIALFSTRHEKKRVYAGDSCMPVKVLVKKMWESREASDVEPYKVKTTGMVCPLGYRWSRDEYSISVKDNTPYVDGVEMSWYDSSPLLVPSLRRHCVIDDEESNVILEIGSLILFGEGVPWYFYESLAEMSARRMEWVEKIQDADVHTDLLRLLLVILELALDRGVIEACPVDRSGSGTQGAAHPTLEGRLWGVLIFLSCLYPTTIAMRKNILTFSIIKGEGSQSPLVVSSSPSRSSLPHLSHYYSHYTHQDFSLGSSTEQCPHDPRTIP